MTNIFIISGAEVVMRQGPSLKQIFKTETRSYSEKKEVHLPPLTQY
jgi:hypothetical protein